MLLQSYLLRSIFSELQSNPIIVLALFGIAMMFLGVVKQSKE